MVVNGETNKDAAWYYPEPKDAAAEIKDRIAFWRGVKVGNSKSNVNVNGKGRKVTQTFTLYPFTLYPLFT